MCTFARPRKEEERSGVCVFVLVWVEYVVYGAYITATDRIASFFFYVVCNFCSDSGMYLFRTWLQFLDRMQCIQPSQEETIFLCVSVLYIYICIWHHSSKISMITNVQNIPSSTENGWIAGHTVRGPLNRRAANSGGVDGHSCNRFFFFLIPKWTMPFYCAIVALSEIVFNYLPAPEFYSNCVSGSQFTKINNKNIY